MKHTTFIRDQSVMFAWRTGTAKVIEIQINYFKKPLYWVNLLKPLIKIMMKYHSNTTKPQVIK